MDAILEKKKMCIVGAGNMAEALLRGILDSGKMQLKDLCLVEIDPERCHYMQERYHVQVVETVEKMNRDIDILLLAVKPQQMTDVLKRLRDSLVLSKTLIVSIAAGIPIKHYEKFLGVNIPVVRVMPNMGALVLQSISAICANQNVSQNEFSIAVNLMECVGDVVRVEERMMDAVTAISGSGPAYFFYLMEILINAAKELNLDADTSVQLVKMTALSAAKLALRENADPELLRKKVTSPGGTTEAAFRVFEQQKFKSTIIQGVKAAYQRSMDISKEASQ